MRKDPLIEHIREWFKKASDEQISNFLDEGLEELIEDLESEDFFGTEGLNYRFG